jgi:hypothetical protein
MQPAAFNRHKYSGKLYKFVIKQIGSNQVAEYYFSKTIQLTAGIDQGQRLNIVTDEPMLIGYLIADIKDRSNNPIFGDMIWQISTANPLLNAFGNVDAYKSRATKYQGSLE